MILKNVHSLWRLKILVHWEKYGLPSTIHAFEISRRTLFNWKARFDKGDRKPEALNPKKRTPQRKRKRIWDTKILEEIKRLREKYPNLGAEKIYPLLLDFTDAGGIEKCPSSSTIERLIVDMGGLRRSSQKISHFGKAKKW
ncbi:MAG: helix-turn-helix domain-containing protein [Patescibacteria group bacterium]